MRSIVVSRLGKYLLLERVNQGGMADVYLAKTFGFGGADQLIALKCIRPEVYADSAFISMFIDEAKLSALLSHGNIAKTYELGRIDDAYFIAMEYVSGRDVRALVDRARARNVEIPPGLALFIIAQVLEGLDYAHRKTDLKGQALHIVHSDVSPKNVLIGYSGDVKVIDFGIARAVMHSAQQAQASRGKLGYMSPEQVRGGHIDARSDVFAVGTLFFELLTNVRLFDGPNDASILEKVRSAEVFPPTLVAPNIAEDVESIVMRALGRDADERYPTAELMHREVVEVMLRRYGHTQARDLGAFVRKLFEDEHRQDLARIERAMQIQAMPERVPMHEPSGVERTAMVHLAAISPISEEVTNPEATRFATILPSGAIAPHPHASTSALSSFATIGGATASIGVVPQPFPLEKTDVERVVDDDRVEETAIVRSPSGLRDNDEDDTVDATAIVRQNGPHAIYRQHPSNSDEDDLTDRVSRGAVGQAAVPAPAPIVAQAVEADPPFEPTRVGVSVEELEREAGEGRVENTDRVRADAQMLVDEPTDRLIRNASGHLLRAGVAAAQVPTAPQNIVKRDEEGTDRVARDGSDLTPLPREVTIIDRSRQYLLRQWNREARGAKNRSRTRWLVLGLAALVVSGGALYGALNRSPRGSTGSLVIVSQPLGAEVLLDGNLVGTTPFSSPRVAVGKHQIVVRDMNGRERKIEVTVKDRDVVSREVDLTN